MTDFEATIRKLTTRVLALFSLAPVPEPATHELLCYDWLRPLDPDGFRINIGGWTFRRPWEWEPGDYVIIHLRDSGSTTRYRVIERKCYTDPDDMWMATLEFAPRPSPEEQAEAER